MAPILTARFTSRHIALTAAAAAATATVGTAVWLLIRRSRHTSSPQSSASQRFTTRNGPATLEASPPSSATVPSSTAPPCAASAPCSHIAVAETSSAVTNVTPKHMPWAIFWDMENVSVPRSVTGSQFVHVVRNALSRYRHPQHPDPILRITAIGNIYRFPVSLRTSLQANGVSLFHIDAKGRKDVADKALITELCLITREHPPPFGVALISGDGDFSYAVGRITSMGYCTVVVAPKERSFSRSLATVPDGVLLLDDIIRPHLQAEARDVPLQQVRTDDKRVGKRRRPVRPHSRDRERVRPISPLPDRLANVETRERPRAGPSDPASPEAPPRAIPPISPMVSPPAPSSPAVASATALSSASFVSPHNSEPSAPVCSASAPSSNTGRGGDGKPSVASSHHCLSRSENQCAVPSCSDIGELSHVSDPAVPNASTAHPSRLEILSAPSARECRRRRVRFAQERRERKPDESREGMVRQQADQRQRSANGATCKVSSSATTPCSPGDGKGAVAVQSHEGQVAASRAFGAFTRQSDIYLAGFVVLVWVVLLLTFAIVFVRRGRFSGVQRHCFSRKGNIGALAD